MGNYFNHLILRSWILIACLNTWEWHSIIDTQKDLFNMFIDYIIYNWIIFI